MLSEGGLLLALFLSANRLDVSALLTWVMPIAMGTVLVILVALAAAIGFSVLTLRPAGPAPKPLDKLREEHKVKSGPAVDHARFEQLAGPFERPQEVTAACIGCHNSRHTEVMASSHWNWERLEYIEGKGIRAVGVTDPS